MEEVYIVDYGDYDKVRSSVIAFNSKDTAIEFIKEFYPEFQKVPNRCDVWAHEDKVISIKSFIVWRCVPNIE